MEGKFLSGLKTNNEAKHKRQEWKNSFDFIFATIGASVGLGNIWRFPYLCFKNGGGAFLIPYFIFAILIAVPAVILETSLGQRVRRGAVQSWKIVPIFRGLPIAQWIIMFYGSLSYPIVLVWTTKYLVKSFSATLPWSTCDNSWNTEHCVTAAGVKNLTTFNSSNINRTSNFNLTYHVNKSISATNEYFVNEVLHLSPSLDQPGALVQDLVVYMLLLWVVFYFCMLKGVKSTAKVVYVTATLPFILIIVILVRGVTLEGAGKGLRFYVIPDATKLNNPEVWVAAGSQLLFSYSVGALPLVTMASYNKLYYNFWRDSFIIAGLNTLVSFLSGVAVFSTLGYMANYQNVSIESVARSGPGLAFIAYPEVISLLPIPQFWGVVFFLTILSLGIDSQFATLEAFMAILYDNFTTLRVWDKTTRAVVYAFLFLICLSMVDEGGVYVFEILNNYGMSGWSVFTTVTCEFVAIGWFFGFDNYWEEIELMIGRRRGKLWLKTSWKFIAPITCSIMALYLLVKQKPFAYGKYTYPVWGQLLCHMVALSSVLFIPGYAIYLVISARMKGESLYKLRRQSFSSDVDEISEVEREKKIRIHSEAELEMLSVVQ
uniref:Transporter n=1 Tax=Phallusia mammillata TaxID=59560 RepID=A0A6F9DT43_9ASCI|nr:sodium- and chloride-dependent GABA transporter 1-like [Phallusia mammillata]